MGLEETMVWLRLQERRAEMLAAARERELAARMVGRRPLRRSGVRRTIGLAIVRLGDWLAAEEQDRSASAAG